MARTADSGHTGCAVVNAGHPIGSVAGPSGKGTTVEGRTAPIRVLELRSVVGSGGGPDKTILLGTAHTNRDEFLVTVCYIRDVRDTYFDLGRRAAELEIDYVELLERHSFDWRVWPALTHLCRSRDIQVVHSHDHKTDLMAHFLGRRLNVAALSTVHGWSGESWRERNLYYPVDKRILTRFPRLIAVSSDIRKELLRVGANADQVTVVLNGIDPDRFRRVPSLRDEVRSTLGLNPEDRVVGSVGRLSREKRFDLLIGAVGALRARWPSVRLLIAGDGPLRGVLQRQIDAAGLRETCLLLGHRTDVVQLHHAFDVFAQSSDHEGTPNAILEAMALETPVVATDAGGTAELARPGLEGWIVPVGSVSGLANACAAVFCDPLNARAISTAARLRVTTELSFRARMRKVEAIYRELAGATHVGVSEHA